MDSVTIADIDALLRLDIGDAGRLGHIKSMLQNGKALYNSDIKYVESLKNSLTEVTSKDPTQNHDDTTGKPSNDNAARQISKDKSNTLHTDTSQGETSPNTAKEDKNTNITNQSCQSSAAWYLLPIFFSIIGGAISYLCLRKQDPPRARKTLILGAILAAVPILLLAGLLIFSPENTENELEKLSEKEIKEQAINNPSMKELFDKNEEYIGRIVYLTGHINQIKHQYDDVYLISVLVNDHDQHEENKVMLQYVTKVEPPVYSDIDFYGIVTGIEQRPALLSGKTLYFVSINGLSVNFIES